MVRVFRDNGRDGLSFLVAQPIKYIPIGDKIELNLGPDPEVIFELVKLRAWRDNIWMQLDGHERLPPRGRAGRADRRPAARSPAGTTTRSTPSGSATTSAKPIELEIRRTFAGHVTFRSRLAAKTYDYQTVQYTATVPPGQKADLLYEILQHQGRNAKQHHVTVEKADVKR